MARIHDEIRARPQLGGEYPPVGFTKRHRAVLHALADALIPPANGFPAPSAVGIADFIGRYLAPTGTPARWYPFLTEDDVKTRLDGIERAGDDPGWAAELETLERAHPEFFTALRTLVYQGYYSHTTVTGLISTMIPGAHDLRRSPQPYGYLDGLEAWDEAALARVRGSYTGTAQVHRLHHLPDYGADKPTGADTAAHTHAEEGT